MITNVKTLNCELPGCEGERFSIPAQPNLTEARLRELAGKAGWLTRAAGARPSLTSAIGSKDVGPLCRRTRSVHGHMAHQLWVHPDGDAEVEHPRECGSRLCVVNTALLRYSRAALNELRVGRYACALDEHGNFIVGAYLTENEATRVQDPKTLAGGAKWPTR